MFSGSFSALARLTAQLGGAPFSVSPRLPGAQTAAVPQVRRVPIPVAAVCQGGLCRRAREGRCQCK